MFGPCEPFASGSGQRSACSVHHQYSSSVSPFHANTGTPAGLSGVPVRPTATAAAAWSCVEKMLQLAQRTSAPRSTSVSMSTAVWIVMCSEPVMRAPLSGLRGPVLLAARDEAGHLHLGQLDLLAAPLGEREIGDLVVELLLVGTRFGCGHCLVLRFRRAPTSSDGLRTHQHSRRPARITG